MKKTAKTDLNLQHSPEAVTARLKNSSKPQYVSDAVLGGIDGCVTTFAIVSGAVGAGFPSSVAIVLGFANLFADGFSMGVSNYESIVAQKEFTDAIKRTEEDHIDRVPEGEREEIRQIFQQKGFSGDTLEEIVKTISDDRQLWIETMLTEEYGIPKATASPWRSGLTTFAAFLLVGAMPLLPFLLAGLSMQEQFLISSAIAAVMFFAVGMLKSFLFSMPVLVSGLRTLLTGSAAAGLAYITGYILRTVFDIA